MADTFSERVARLRRSLLLGEEVSSSDIEQLITSVQSYSDLHQFLSWLSEGQIVSDGLIQSCSVKEYIANLAATLRSPEDISSGIENVLDSEFSTFAWCAYFALNMSN